MIARLSAILVVLVGLFLAGTHGGVLKVAHGQVYCGVGARSLVFTGCNISFAAPYSGPGDQVASATMYWGFRGYTAAFSGNVATICDVATGLTCANATWAAGSLTIPLIGGSSCTSIACNVSEMFDQTGSTNCSGTACHGLQATNASRPGLVVNCTGRSRPCLTTTGTQFLQTANSFASVGQLTQPNSMSIYVERTGRFTTQDVYFSDSNCSGAVFASSTNTGGIYAQSAVATYAMSDSTLHALQLVFNGASSSANVDGSNAAVTGNPGTSIIGNGSFPLRVGSNACGSPTMSFSEGGIWPIGFSGGNLTALSGNQAGYW